MKSGTERDEAEARLRHANVMCVNRSDGEAHLICEAVMVIDSLHAELAALERRLQEDLRDSDAVKMRSLRANLSDDAELSEEVKRCGDWNHGLFILLGKLRAELAALRKKRDALLAERESAATEREIDAMERAHARLRTKGTP